MVDVVKKIKLSTIKYSQVFNRVGPSYEGLAKFAITYQYVGLPRERYNFGFTDVQFHTVSTAPTLYRDNVNCCRLQSSAELMAL
jgi:hypothetical protein